MQTAIIYMDSCYLLNYSIYITYSTEVGLTMACIRHVSAKFLLYYMQKQVLYKVCVCPPGSHGGYWAALVLESKQGIACVTRPSSHGFINHAGRPAAATVVAVPI